jgi:ATP-dependent DNA ligase
MLATLAAKPFDEPGWMYEEKYDGHRILAYKEGARVLLLSRGGKVNTPRFPTIVATIQRLPRDTLPLDGEVVAFDSKGISRFQLLQQSKVEPVYAVFDCLWVKVKVRREDEFAIVGYTAPEGSRGYFGALLLGTYEHGELKYVGKVGTGFDRDTPRQEKIRQLRGRRRARNAARACQSRLHRSSCHGGSGKGTAQIGRLARAVIAGAGSLRSMSSL